MSHIAPPPARSRPSPSDNKNNSTKPKSQAHPLPPNPMHHQGFIKQQVKSANNATLHSQYPPNGYTSHRYPHGSAAAHVNPISQPYSGAHGSSTASSATSGSSSMYSALSSSSTQPSPATSSTSSVSSLRTPPDFLMHGATSMTKMERSRKVFMSMEEIDERLKLLDTLTSDLTPILPPEPGSRRTEAKASIVKREISQSSSPASKASRSQAGRASTQSPSKTVAPVKADTKEISDASAVRPRKRQSDMHDELPSFRKKAKVEPASSQPKIEDAAGTDDVKPLIKREGSTAQATQPSPSQLAVALPKREWSKELFVSTHAAYLDLGRTLKHSADRRVKESASASTTPDSKEQLMASFEATEAILCFAYAFWCDDQVHASSGSCNASHWSSLLELLHYARSRHNKSGHLAFSGLCRYVEALVLQRLANSEKKHVQEQLSRLAAAEAEGEESSLSLPQLSASLSKALVDEETSRQLLIQARSKLSQEVLSKEFPEVWAASILGRSTLKARDVDPASVEPEGDPESDAIQGQWSWPMDSTVSFPHVVCFGRALLREGARRLSLPYLICSPPS